MLREHALNSQADPHKKFIDLILGSEWKAPHKQRYIIARRIFHRLQEDDSFEGKYTIVCEYMTHQRQKGKEMLSRCAIFEASQMT